VVIAKKTKLEYKREGFALFQEMIFRIRENVCRALTHIHVQQDAPAEQAAQDIAEDSPAVEARGLDLTHRDHTKAAAYVAGGAVEAPKAQAKVGRNDLCPCGSGKKYKKCCGRGQ
jgi:preprotein translocase subunit SecA